MFGKKFHESKPVQGEVLTASRDIIEEIKSRLDIVEVIRKTVSLHKETTGRYAGATSPTSKSGASLKVDHGLQAFKNFADGKGGDVFDWIGYTHNLDARGAGFPEVLRIAADLAGVELEGATEEEKAAATEKADIQNTFTEAAETYHNKLMERPELIEFIFDKWGITKDTIKRFKIGYATLERDLKALSGETLNKSGLVYLNNGKLGGEVFRGRIIFPYWKNGKVVYLVGRATNETPKLKDGNEPPKYQKLLVYKEGREHISPAVQNSYFYGEDSLRSSDYCVITEGVADCIVMLQAGIPCISPVTVQFRDKDHLKLISLTERLKRVYICNDNEANKAGLMGALSTAQALEVAGIEAKLIELPKPEGLDKIDIADYMKDHCPEDFKELIDSSIGYWTYKLNQLVIPVGLSSHERSRAFRSFIENDLLGMHPGEWALFVDNEVLKKFKLKYKETEVIRNGAYIKIHNKYYNIDETKESEQGQSTEENREFTQDVTYQANEILDNGDPFKFILDTWNKLHVGDTNIGENLLCSAVCTHIENAKLGLHQKPSGEFGSGKSDATKKMTILLPAHKCIEGSISSKALFYDENLKMGTIVYVDDSKLTDDIIVTLRAITSDFQEPTKHRTLTRTKDGRLVADNKIIPPRVTLWMTSVEGIQDKQLESRFCFGDTDETPEQDQRVNDHQKNRLRGPVPPELERDILICRCIFDIIFKETYMVYGPLVDAVKWNNPEHRRNHEKFMDLLQAVTVFKFRKREKAHGGIVATLEDYDRALKIYMGVAAKNATNLTGRELKVIEEIQRSPGHIISFPELAKKTNLPLTTLRYLIDGRNGKEGLLGKIIGLEEVDKTDTVGDEYHKVATKAKLYKYSGDLFAVNSKIYQTVASIDRELAVKLTNDFLASDSGVIVDTDCENRDNNRNYHTSITDNVIVKNDVSINGNNNKINKITNSQECIGALEKSNSSSSGGKNLSVCESGIHKSCDFCDSVIVEEVNDSREHENKKNSIVVVEPKNVICDSVITDSNK